VQRGESCAWQCDRRRSLNPLTFNVPSHRGDGSTQPARSSLRRVASPFCFLPFSYVGRGDASVGSSHSRVHLLLTPSPPGKVQGAHRTRGGSITRATGLTLFHHPSLSPAHAGRTHRMRRDRSASQPRAGSPPASRAREKENP